MQWYILMLYTIFKIVSGVMTVFNEAGALWDTKETRTKSQKLCIEISLCIGFRAFTQLIVLRVQG